MKIETKIDLVGKVLWGTYKVTKLLGIGGFGSVFEAENVRLGRHFAVKVLSPDLLSDTEVVQRFRREAKIATDLHHPNIVDIIDFNETEGGHLCIVMEFLEGEDLARRIGRLGSLATREVVDIARQVSAALSMAHSRGIVHRDLKPGNIYLCKAADGTTTVKVIDFGISKILGSKSMLTQEAALLGTPHYMAPEQVEGRIQDIGPWSDVFSFGAILYQMLSGAAPFDGESYSTVLYKVVYVAPAALAELNPGVPRELVEIVEKCLAKAPADRFSSGADLAQALDRVDASLRAGSAELGRAPTSPLQVVPTGPQPVPRTVAPPRPMTGPTSPLGSPPPSSTPSMTGPVSSPAPLSSAPVTTLSSAAGEARAAPVAAPASSARGVIPAVVVAVVLAGALGLFLSRGSGGAEDRGETKAADVSSLRKVPPPPPPAAPSPPPGSTRAEAKVEEHRAVQEKVLVRVKGSPEGAAILDPESGSVLGKVPAEVRWPRASTPARFEVVYKGYQKALLRVTDELEQDLDVKLQPEKSAKRKKLDPDHIPNPFDK
jgi:eukaryotic-like serine/threonine-protein kinase